jgi:pimeloyl-ACP methyl ester carboxylesterase
MSATAVLVHGAWHGAWCFDRVLPRLSDAGIPAIAVDLPGHGADPGPLGDLHTDAARVTKVLDTLDGEIVLLGHSYGGAVITEAGAHPRVRHLVYLCAMALDQGETCLRAGGPEAKAIDHTGRPNIGAAVHSHPDGTTTIDPSAVGPVLYGDCDPDTVAWATAHLGPQPAVTMAQEPAVVAWRTKPSTYVVCTEDMTIHPDLQRLLARRCTDAVEWSTSHSPFASRPEMVAELLLGLAR